MSERVDNFSYTERRLGYVSDNLIIYDAGPINISISGWNDKIVIQSTEKWKYLLPQILEVAIEAWELSNEQITYKDLSIEIIYNFNNLKLYIEHSIIFK